MAKTVHILDLENVNVDKKIYHMDEWTVYFSWKPLFHRKKRCLATTDFNTNRITINARVTKKRQRECFLHEILHIMDDFKDTCDKDGGEYLSDDEEYTMFRETVISITLDWFDWVLRQRGGEE